MTIDHTSVDELLAARALDGLDPEEAERLEREMAAHGNCETCRQLEREHRETASMLALALEPRPIDAEVVERILQSSGRETPTDIAARRGDPRLRRWQAAFGVAAVVAAALAFVLATRPGAPDVVPSQRFVPFEGGGGELAVAYSPGDRGLVLWGTDLPDPGPGRVYELWLFEDGTPSRAACLSPKDGAVGAYLDADLTGAEMLAVTVEAPSCPDAPTTEPVYTASLD
jgi:hypothetical protein